MSTATAPVPGRAIAVFDELADEYDRRRPTYPEQLVTSACELCGTGSGDRVLEIGCGSGQLTSSLLARGLHVLALEPGARLLSLARRNLEGYEKVEFARTCFEEAELPRGQFRAVFSASAFHWLDPRVSWRRVAEVLAPGGALALIQYFGVADPRSDGDQDALLATLRRIAPEIAASWPSYRDLTTMLAGVNERRQNMSEAWSWLGGYTLGQPCAGDLFGEAQIAAVPVLLEQSAEALNALTRTLSFYGSLAPEQRQEFEREAVALQQRLGRPIRSSTAAVVLAARKSSPT